MCAFHFWGFDEVSGPGSRVHGSGFGIWGGFQVGGLQFAVCTVWRVSRVLVARRMWHMSSTMTSPRT